MTSLSLDPVLLFDFSELLTDPTPEPPNLTVVPSPSTPGAWPYMGHTEARIFTPPLRALTPETSYGFAVIDFARDVLEEPLDPWQEWAVIHAGELYPDNRPRFRKVLIMVARQNGKTHLLKVLIQFWMFVEEWPVILGISTNLNYAKKAWEKVVRDIQRRPHLRALMPSSRNMGIRRAAGEVEATTANECVYAIAAGNSKGGRSLSIDRLITDELREQTNWDAYNASIPAMAARPLGQAFFITNQGPDKAVVLHSLRDQAIQFIETGEGDERLGLLEWSAPEGSDVMDPRAWAMASPNLGRRLHPDDLRSEALKARQGSVEEGNFKTEYLCIRVKTLDGAVDPISWKECHVPGEIKIGQDSIALCLDISPDQEHATLVAAAVQANGRVRVRVVRTWEGNETTKKLRTDLVRIIETIKPKALGWFPVGPAATMAAELQDRTSKGHYKWPPKGVTVEAIRGEVSAVCMGFSALVRDLEVMHADEDILNDHVTGASKYWTADTWKFLRRGVGHCDAAYAAAGAVHLARTLPVSIGKPRLVTVSEPE